MSEADEKVFFWINSLTGEFPALDRIMGWLVSDYLIPVTLALALIGLWFAGRDDLKRYKYQIGVLAALISMAASNLAVYTVNAVYFRPRPFVDHEVTLLFYRPTDSSFPANSMASLFGIAAAVWSVNRRAGTLFMLGAILFGFARVYAGVHYPLDIIAGALIGVVVTFLVLQLKKPLEPVLSWALKAARVLCIA